jgi:hypothetical protein
MAAQAGYSGDVAGSPGKEDEQELLDAFRARLKHAQSHWSEWRTEARELYDLVSGHQWSTEDEAKMKEDLRPMVTFNVAGKYIDAVLGLQINNRQQTQFFPREMGDAVVNEQLTGAVDWARDLCNQADEESDAFFDCIVTGLGWMECWLDKDLDPAGVPCGRRIDPLEMYVDPASRQRNFEDARYLIRLRYIDHDEYKELFGEEYSPTDREFDTVDMEDEEIELIQTPQDYDNPPGPSQGAQPSSKKCPVADYQYWKREERWIVTVPGLGEKELTDAQYEKAKEFLDEARAAGKPVQAQKVKKRCYYRALISGNKVGKSGKSSYQRGFTFHGITGKRDRNKNTWYGIGRAILDPQRWVNKFFSTILYTLMTNAKGGLLAEQNAFVDSRKAESEWARPESITWLKDGSLSGVKPKVMEKPIAKYPEGLDRLMQFSMAALPQTSGLNLELMGLADRVQAGVVEAQRKQSAMAIIAWAFDAMRRYYRSIGRQQAQYVIDYMPEGTLIMINGEASKQYVPLVKNQNAVKFDVVVDEAPTSVNMKERVWAVLENIIPALIKAGIKIPPEVLDYSPLPADLAQKWKKAMQPSPEEQQAQQRAREAELAKTEGEAAEKHTGAELNKAQAQKALADAGALPMDQNTEVQGEIQKAQIKANADMQIAQMKAMLDAQVEKMKAELKAQTELQIAQMEARVMTQLTGAELQQEGALKQQELAQKGALEHDKMHHDATMQREQRDTDSSVERDRIKSDERVGRAKVKASAQKPSSSNRSK